jgi:hypothetical protein
MKLPWSNGASGSVNVGHSLREWGLPLAERVAYINRKLGKMPQSDKPPCPCPTRAWYDAAVSANPYFALLDPPAC